jgi:hypothetical protein
LRRYKFKGLLLTLKQEDHAHLSKSKTFHKHFGEKMAASMEAEVGKDSLSVLDRDGREEGGGRRVLDHTHSTDG